MSRECTLSLSDGTVAGLAGGRSVRVQATFSTTEGRRRKGATAVPRW